MRARLFLLLVAAWLAGFAQPLSAAVTITFWSHDQDQNFPHAFFALKGVPDAGGPAVDANYGFTAKAVTPAILLGSVGGRVEDAKPAYMRRSDAQFAVVLTDAQYAAIEALIAAWRADSRYHLGKRNCVHFVGEAAKLAGLTVPELPRLMKKPRAYLEAVAAANPGRIVPLAMTGAAYFARDGASATVGAR